MSEQTPPTDSPSGDERQRSDRRSSDRRSGDRRQGPRRVLDRIRDMGTYQQLTMSERIFMFSLVLLVGVILGSVIYVGIWFIKGGNTQPNYPEVAETTTPSRSNLIDPFVPADNTAYMLQLCPRLMLDNSIKMRLFKTIDDFNSCESNYSTHRRLDERCKTSTTAMISGETKVKTSKCSYLGSHQSHWCEVIVQEGPDMGAKGYVPWDCFTPQADAAAETSR
jgi:hypothetical protein